VYDLANTILGDYCATRVRTQLEYVDPSAIRFLTAAGWQRYERGTATARRAAQ
jgi:hypothetical protein